MRRLLNCCAKVRSILVLGTSLFLLVACADSIRATEPPQLDQAPDGLLAACPRPVRLPDRSLMQAEVEAFWLTDRRRLIECGASKAALREYYVNRDALITASAPQS